MAELARSVPIKELAERRGIPEQFLEQLFSTLRRARLRTSHRGEGRPHAGRPAEEINVLAVVQALDGKIGQEAPARCARCSAARRSPRSLAAASRGPARLMYHI
jgi:DNA-binding IscR family transcriptional regulator